jgi:hypothetical protein
LPDWLEESPSFVSQKLFSKERQQEMAENAEIGIRDLPVWKEYVQRYGIEEARNILRRGLLMNQITDGNPEN